MRFYDYKCPGCSKVIEVYEKTDDDQKDHPCPECPGNMKRIISISQFNTKKMPQGWRLTPSQRKELWKSDDINDFRRIG